MAFLLFIKIIVIKMHIIVIDTSDITSGIDISPYGNFINLSIKSTAEKISLISIKNQGATNIAIVIIAETIWFSVRLDTNIPIDIAAIATKINPSIVASIVGIFTVPKKLTITA